ncbi:hypothetical protein A0J61_02181 [Choanephora cucurbitarum]|uniref:Uncharacterized protein n=1 Tax=Choanephora cucurbitarum TaxID=101091 RepID=A0A1C7NL13_9FUNG|nr:hypothetical protein A0J61_02181 [Choanephora cucurbitarum]
MRLVSFLSITSLIFFSVVSAQDQQCQGIDILYPKSDSVVKRSQDETSTYLILGNTGDKDISLSTVSLVYINPGTNEEAVNETWSGSDKLLKASAIQQSLDGLGEVDLPNTFWFRITANQPEGQCQLESDKFRIEA